MNTNEQVLVHILNTEPIQPTIVDNVDLPSSDNATYVTLQPVQTTESSSHPSSINNSQLQNNLNQQLLSMSSTSKIIQIYLALF